jgi:hypothetical protein
MSLQMAATSLSNVGNPALQAYQSYNYAPVNSKLDPITKQILNTHDAALEVMHQIESGATARFWEAQKKLPSATWLGDLMDWFLGWGKYHPDSEKKVAGQKRAIMSYECPNVNHTNGDIVRDYINTSFEMHKYPNNSCLQLDSKLYWTQFYMIIFRPVGAEDPICRIADCIKERLEACYPTCLPCQNATEDEKDDMLNTTSSNYYFTADFDEHLWWVYLIQRSYRYKNTTLNAWKLEQIHKLFNATRVDCENQILHTPANPAMQALYSLLIIPVAVAGGVIFVVYKRKQANPAYESLESAVNNA